MTRRVFVVIALMCGFTLGAVATLILAPDTATTSEQAVQVANDSAPTTAAVSTATPIAIVVAQPTSTSVPASEPTPSPSSTAAPAAPAVPTPTFIPLDSGPVGETAAREPLSDDRPVAAQAAPGSGAAQLMAQVLSDGIVLPSDCGLPVGEPASLPNSPREYRSGIHAGIDFICSESGRIATAALPGRVVFRVDNYVDPAPADRIALLAIAGSVRRTPPWTLAMLYGNVVVIDHGVIDGVGHTISIYAHLDQVDANARLGSPIEAGAVVGVIGNSGTSSAGNGIIDPRSIHLHWELHIDNVYLGAGLTAAETAAVYAELFAPAP